MADSFDPYYKWLAIPPQEQPPNYYRLLGVPVFTSDPEVLETLRTSGWHVRSAQVDKDLLSHRILNELSAEDVCSSVAPYDRQLGLA
jgi:hypothetical protein